MNERIKELRRALGFTQTELGAKIGVKGNTITNYEAGLRTPSDAVIFSICREFNVSETWLRNGEGDMFVSLSRDEEIAAFMGDVMAGEDGDFRRRLVSILSRLGPDEWKLLERMAVSMAEEIKKADP